MDLQDTNLSMLKFSDLFPFLPERSRFSRKRRNLCDASEKLRQALIHFLPNDEIFIVDSFLIPVCDFKRVPTSTFPLKCADGTGTLAAYGKCATKALNTFFGFRGSVSRHLMGSPVDFAIVPQIRMIEKCSPYSVERGTYTA